MKGTYKGEYGILADIMEKLAEHANVSEDDNDAYVEFMLPLIVSGKQRVIKEYTKIWPEQDLYYIQISDGSWKHSNSLNNKEVMLEIAKETRNFFLDTSQTIHPWTLQQIPKQQSLEEQDVGEVVIEDNMALMTAHHQVGEK